jgi:hypothetical protein
LGRWGGHIFDRFELGCWNQFAVSLESGSQILINACGWDAARFAGLPEEGIGDVRNGTESNQIGE